MERVDLVHACYGGEGGQLSAVQVLTEQLNLEGIASGVIALAPPAEMLADDQTWSEMTAVVRIYIRKRADMSSMFQALSAVRRIRPRVVVCHSHRHAPALFFGQLLARRLPRVVTVEHHSVDLRSRGDNFRSAIALLFSCAVVVLTPDFAERYPLKSAPLPGLRLMALIPNGVVIPADSLKRDKIHPRPVIGMASRLVASKDYGTLIRAVKKLTVMRPDSDPLLLIAGDGPMLSELEELVSELGITHHVQFLGHLNSEAMGEFYGMLDAYSHSTLGENMSISLLEAAAASVPIVATDVIGVSSLFVDGHSAVLVPAGNVEALARGIELVSKHSVGHALAANAYRMVSDNFSAGSMARGYQSLFISIDPRGHWGTTKKIGK